MNIITEKHIAKSLNYEQYRELILDLYKKGYTTGVIQNPELLEFSNINIHRMNRLDKTVIIDDRIKNALVNIKQTYIWLVLTEAWCGDAAQSLPIIAKAADLCQNIQLVFLLRDDNLDIMDDNLSGKSRSIPKLICLNSVTFDKLYVWGPRPEKLINYVNEMKERGDVSKPDLLKAIQLWYNQDNTKEIQNELLKMIGSSMI